MAEIPSLFWPVLGICMLFQVFLFMFGVGDLVQSLDALDAPDGFFSSIAFIGNIAGLLFGVLVDILTGAELDWPAVIKVPVLVFCDFVLLTGLFILLAEGLKAVGAITPFTVVLAVLLLPVAAAGAGEGYASDGTDVLQVDWSNADKAPLGDSFTVTGTASTTWAGITLGSLATNGCSVVSDTTSAVGQSVTFRTEFRVTDTTCQWSRVITADDGIGNTAEVAAGGTVRADLAPIVFWFGIFALAWWRGIKNSLAWTLPLFVSTLVILTTLLPDALSGIAVPNKYAAVAMTLLFGLLFLGLKAIQSQQVKQ